MTPLERQQFEHKCRRPVLSWDGHRFNVYKSYAVRSFLKHSGFAWDVDNKCWFTTSPRIALKALEYANDEVRKMLIYHFTN